MTQSALRVGSAAPLVLVLGLMSPRAGAAIYGEDDRVESLQYPDALWQERAERSVVAMVNPEWSPWLVCGEDDEVILPDITLGEAMELCDGERFADQLQLASCSATLIDYDLVATAGHCMLDDGQSACPTVSFVTGLHYGVGDEPPAPTVDDIYSCRQVVAQLPALDLAIVGLDRPVDAPYEPAPMSPVPAVIDDAIGIIGFPSGIPMKTATECTMLTSTPTRLGHNCDSFGGNSGSGTFSLDTVELVGVHNSGIPSYEFDGDCRVARVLTQDGHIPGVESAPQLGGSVPIEAILPELCDAGWPGPPCGLTASCGDGQCTGLETADSCPDDCLPPECGDGICEVLSELGCEVDCGHLTAECPAEPSGEDTTGESSGGGEDGTTGDETTGDAPMDGSTTSTSGEDDPGSETSSGGSAEGGGDGCGCRASTGPAGGWSASLLLVGLGALRRRGRS